MLTAIWRATSWSASGTARAHSPRSTRARRSASRMTSPRASTPVSSIASRAYDSFASYSSYTTSPSRTIDNNTAPVIACDLSGDLGEKSEGFTIPYTVSDAEQQEVTVTERVGDLVKRTYKPTLGWQYTFRSRRTSSRRFSTAHRPCRLLPWIRRASRPRSS